MVWNKQFLLACDSKTGAFPGRTMEMSGVCKRSDGMAAFAALAQLVLVLRANMDSLAHLFIVSGGEPMPH